MYLTPFVVLEVLGTLAKKARIRALTRREHRTFRSAFLTDVQVTFTLSTVDDAVLSTASGLVDRHRQIAAGAMDVLHVASALHLEARMLRRPVVLATSDHGMLALAKVTGLKTFDPEVEPLAALLAATG